mgnify:FL=1
MQLEAEIANLNQQVSQYHSMNANLSEKYENLKLNFTDRRKEINCF